MNKRHLLNICILQQSYGMEQAGAFRAVRNYMVTFPELPESPYYGRTTIHWFLQRSFSDSGKIGELHPECYSYQLIAGRHPTAIKYLVYIGTIKQRIPYHIRPADPFLIQKHFQVFGQAASYSRQSAAEWASNPCAGFAHGILYSMNDDVARKAAKNG